MPLIDLLYPPVCASCGARGWPLCAACSQQVAVAVPPRCDRCGRPTEEPLATCAECPPRVIDVTRAPFVYSGPVTNAIRAMKFSGWRALGAHLSSAMVRVAADLGADVVTWVPLSRRRRARRGFDQAEVLARGLARGLDLQVRRLLERRRDTSEQARRGARERRTALRDAFSPRRQSPPSVMLVDDVLTTGSTAAACSAALRASGAKRVVVVVAARSLRDPAPARCFGRGTRTTGSVR